MCARFLLGLGVSSVCLAGVAQQDVEIVRLHALDGVTATPYTTSTLGFSKILLRGLFSSYTVNEGLDILGTP